MASSADRLFRQALKLAPDERARLVAELLPSRSDEEWIREIERRARAAKAGNPGVSWTEARDQIQNQLISS